MVTCLICASCPGPRFCFCHLASAETRNDITTHTPMGFLQATSSLIWLSIRNHLLLPWWAGLFSPISPTLSFSSWTVPHFCPVVVIHLILFCSLHIGHGQPYSLSWLRFSGDFSTKLQAHANCRAPGGSSLPTGSLLENKPSDRALPPTPLPQASPSLGLLSLPTATTLAWPFAAASELVTWPRFFLVFLEWSFAKSCGFVTPKLYNLLVTHSDQAAPSQSGLNLLFSLLAGTFPATLSFSLPPPPCLSSTPLPVACTTKSHPVVPMGNLPSSPRGTGSGLQLQNSEDMYWMNA